MHPQPNNHPQPRLNPVAPSTATTPPDAAPILFRAPAPAASATSATSAVSVVSAAPAASTASTVSAAPVVSAAPAVSAVSAASAVSRMPGTMRVLAALLLVLVCVHPVAPSAEEPVPGSPKSTERKYTLNLDNADILDLIKWASQLTNKTVVLHPSVRGKVTVLAGDPMNHTEAYELFQAILQVNGLAIVEDKDNITVTPGNEAKISGTQLAGTLTGDGVAIYVIKIHNTTANAIYTSILPLVTKTGFVAADNNTNKILIADRRNNVKKIVGIVSELDRDEGLEIEIIPIKHASAQNLVTAMEKLLTSNPNRNQGPARPTLTIDQRTNSILLSANTAVRDQIHELIAALDVPLQGGGDSRVFRLEYITVADVLTILQGIAERHNQPAGGQSGQAPRDPSDHIAIQSSENLNLLVISAPAAQMSKIQGIIAEIDVPRPQVLVEAMIMEIAEESNDSLGVQWLAGGITNSGVGDSGNIVGGGFRNFPRGTAPFTIDSATSSIGLANGFSLGYFENGDLRAILNTILTDSKANILSTPTILALDNEEASILVGSNVPLISGNQTQSTSGNVLQTITRRDIGVSLSVIPQINNAGTITLTINQSVENLTQANISTADVVTNKRELKTKVIIRDRQILVLGGLIRDEITEGKTRVPLLGHIPGIGKLFSSTTIESNKRNLMVFIRPTILRNGEQASRASADRYNFLRSLRRGQLEEQETLFRSKREGTELSGPENPDDDSFINYKQTAGDEWRDFAPNTLVESPPAQPAKPAKRSSSDSQPCRSSKRVGTVRRTVRRDCD
ncbi:MAG: type II secretion system secretin GspD [Gammaproteobacteria bacterium]|nr:type II secretion system secretin GspD [Gammaproteobacteria bacterium]